MIQVVMVIIASAKLEKNSSSGFPLTLRCHDYQVFGNIVFPSPQQKHKKNLNQILVAILMTNRAFSPMLARATPRMMAKNTSPRMLDPPVHSPLNFQVRVLLGSRHCPVSSWQRICAFIDNPGTFLFLRYSKSMLTR